MHITLKVHSQALAITINLLNLSMHTKRSSGVLESGKTACLQHALNTASVKAANPTASPFHILRAT